jgi:hypothetical protein
LELKCGGGDFGEGDDLEEGRLGEEMDVVCLSRDKAGGEGGVREIWMEVLLDLPAVSREWDVSLNRRRGASPSSREQGTHHCIWSRVLSVVQ